MSVAIVTEYYKKKQLGELSFRLNIRKAKWSIPISNYKWNLDTKSPVAILSTRSKEQLHSSVPEQRHYKESFA